jgi:ABC-type uncharacterized transport system permease subunit
MKFWYFLNFLAHMACSKLSSELNLGIKWLSYKRFKIGTKIQISLIKQTLSIPLLTSFMTLWIDRKLKRQFIQVLKCIPCMKRKLNFNFLICGFLKRPFPKMALRVFRISAERFESLIRLRLKRQSNLTTLNP